MQNRQDMIDDATMRCKADRRASGRAVRAVCKPGGSVQRPSARLDGLNDGRHVARALEEGDVGEGGRALGAGDGQEAFIEAVLHLREGESVGAVEEGVLDVHGDLVQHHVCDHRKDGCTDGHDGVVDIGHDYDRRGECEEEQTCCEGLRPREGKLRVVELPASNIQ
jgi:hypothetical protein